MHTEASHRFERGADPEAPPMALARIAHLAEKIGAGTTRPGLIDRHPRPIPRRTVVLPHRARDRAAGRAGGRRRRAAHPDRPRLRGGEAGERRASRWGFPPGAATSPARSTSSRRSAVISGLNRLPSTIPPAGGAEGLRPAQVRDRAHARRPRRGRPRRGRSRIRSCPAGGPVPARARPRQPAERGPEGPAHVARVARACSP